MANLTTALTKKESAKSNLKSGKALVQRKQGYEGCNPGFRSKAVTLQDTPFLQAKLRVGPPNDACEREADRVADQVMRMPEPSVQRQEEKEEEQEVLQAKALVSRKANLNEGCKTEAPPIVQEILHSPGHPLERSVRQSMESRFAHNFREVRVHTDTKSAESARALNAKAYTVGQNVVFGAGQFAPGTTTGRRLLAHELTHVIHQQNGIGSNPAQALCAQPIVQRRNGDARWRWTSVEGNSMTTDQSVEVEDYTQRFVGLVMPRRAMLSYNAMANRYRTDTDAEATVRGSASFVHFESFARFIARGWRIRSAAMSDARRLQLDPHSGSITLAVPTHGSSAGSTPTRDGPLSITARITNTQVQAVNDTHKKLVVTAKVHANIGGSITESVTGGATVGVGGELAEASVNVGGTWSITHDGGERYALVDRTPTFVFHARKETESD